MPNSSIKGATQMNGEKYDYHFVLDEETVRQGNDSHSKILQQVRAGSTVLECGPGGGLMTRYLKETLCCTVYILEVDPDCYTKTICYADGGVCADLEQDDWMSEFEDKFFDYILYADVLEHLRNPQTVLIKMKHFLKPEGRVLLSVPNVANGDIIANLLCDQFTYTPLGLLDDTHVHLFARQNLREMIRASGYYLAYETCTRVPLFASEQGKFIPEERRSALKQALIDHPTYHIYQYICCLTQGETELISDVEDKYMAASSRFYFDFGKGLCEEHRIDVHPEVLQNDRLRYTVRLPEGCTAVRYDPIEFCRCILREIIAEVDGVSVAAQPLNGLTVGKFVFFPTEDPQVSIIPPTGGQLLTLETTWIPENADWDEVGGMIAELKSFLAQETTNLELERADHAEAVQALEAERADHAEAVQALEAERAAHAEAVQALETERAAHARTAQALYVSEAERNAMENSRSWKITKPLRALKRLFMPRGG